MKKLKIVFISVLVLVLGYASIKIIPSFNNLRDKITGGAGAGLLLSRPKSASFVMIIILLAVIAFFNRKRIKEIIEKIKEKRSEKL